MEKAFYRKSVIAMFLAPALIIYCAFVIVTIVWAAGYSFFDWDGMGAKTFVGLENYIRLFTRDRSFWPVVGNTIIYTVIQIAIQIVGGLLFAIFLSRVVRFRAGLQTMYYMPVVISSVAICQIFSKLLSVTPMGVVNALLSKINPAWYNLEWISSPDRSLYVAAFVEGYKYLGLYMVIFYAALIGVPADLTEAATIDGASTFRQYWNIKIPYIKPVILTNCVLVLNGSMRSFDISFLLTKGGPGHTSELLATNMYKQAFSSLKYGYGSAVAVAIVIFCVIIGIVFQKITHRGEDD